MSQESHQESLLQKQRDTIAEKLMSPLAQFMRLEVSGGILLFITTAVALIWANSPWAASYEHIFHVPIGVSVGDFQFSHSFLHWINDALMVIFFFVVGLEIKREIVKGELSSWQKASLPLVAAVGGMVVPALIYATLNPTGEAARGWGIPMATDIAFAIGVLSLLGKRVPLTLKIFLLALAIADDLGAILVIALFYTDHLALSYVWGSLFTVGALVALQKMGVWRKSVYLLLGVLLWFFVLKSGIHATIAGVVLGFLTPARPFWREERLASDINILTQAVATHAQQGQGALNQKTVTWLSDAQYVFRESAAPTDSLIRALHPWVTFLVLPLFALGNAGVSLEGLSLASIYESPITLGVLVGLFVGKPLGIVGFSWLAVALKFSALPPKVSWSAFFGMSSLAGIGFTMSLFVGNLALGSSPDLETASKLGILIGSAFSAVLGAGYLFLNLRSDESEE